MLKVLWKSVENFFFATKVTIFPQSFQQCVENSFCQLVTFVAKRDTFAWKSVPDFQRLFRVLKKIYTLHKTSFPDGYTGLAEGGFFSRMSLMISSTSSRRLESFLRASLTVLIAYTIVEWSRPPNSIPIAANGIPVTSRTT